MTAPLVEPVASLAAARDDWDALAPLCGHPFATWEWADAWWRELGAGELMLRRVRRPDGSVAALLPLYLGGRGPAVVARFLGHGAGDQLGPVAAPADAPLVARALGAVARELPARGLLLAERLAAEEPLWRALSGRRVRWESSPQLPIDGRSWEGWLASRSSNFRQQVRRRERKLEREHGLRYRLTTDRERLGADLDVLVGLHHARWGDGSNAFAPERERLHRDFAARALERGWLRLWIAEVDGGRPVAAWYGMRYAGSEWYYQAGRDPSWDGLSVGFVLLAHTIRAAFEDGMRSYRFGLGDEPYKERFAERDAGLVSLTVGRRPAALVAAGVARAARSMPPGVRRAVVRRAG